MKFVLIVMVVMLLGGCLAQKGDEMTGFLTAKDGTNIAYDFWQGNKEMFGVLLVHQLPASKESWSSFVTELTAKGYSVLAIDYRGRGQSSGQLQTPQDFQNIALDVDAGIDFLKTKGVKSMIVIGASIGANHALFAAIRRSEVTSAVLLSPGLEYRGVKTESAASQITKPLLIVASEDDAYSTMSANKIYSLAKGKKELKIFDTAGHGTDMFSEPNLIPIIISFLEENLVK